MVLTNSYRSKCLYVAITDAHYLEYKAEIEIMEKTKKDLELIKNASQKKQSVNKKQHSTFFMQVHQLSLS